MGAWQGLYVSPNCAVAVGYAVSFFEGIISSALLEKSPPSLHAVYVKRDCQVVDYLSQSLAHEKPMLLQSSINRAGHAAILCGKERDAERFDHAGDEHEQLELVVTGFSSNSNQILLMPFSPAAVVQLMKADKNFQLVYKCPAENTSAEVFGVYDAFVADRTVFLNRWEIASVVTSENKKLGLKTCRFKLEPVVAGVALLHPGAPARLQCSAIVEWEESLKDNPILLESAIARIAMRHPSLETEELFISVFQKLQQFFYRLHKSDSSSYDRFVDNLFAQTSKDAHGGFKSAKEMSAFMLSEVLITRFHFTRFFTVISSLAYNAVDMIKLNPTDSLKQSWNIFWGGETKTPIFLPHIAVVYPGRFAKRGDSDIQEKSTFIAEDVPFLEGNVRLASPVSPLLSVEAFGGACRFFRTHKHEQSALTWPALARQQKVPIINHVSSGLAMELAIFERLLELETTGVVASPRVTRSYSNDLFMRDSMWRDTSQSDYQRKIALLATLAIAHYQRSGYHSFAEGVAALHYFLEFRMRQVGAVAHSPFELLTLFRQQIRDAIKSEISVYGSLRVSPQEIAMQYFDQLLRLCSPVVERRVSLTLS